MTTTIGVLRMTGASRVRAEAAASALGLAAAGHDRSVLIVRRLRVAAGDREQARAELASARDRAARPSLGPADPAAGAVLFSDEAEMLACLTSDVAAGRRPWYWRHVLPPGASDTGAALAAVWVARARWLPAALALLADGESAAAARLIGPAQAGRVLAALAAEFAMDGLPPVRAAEPVTAEQGDEAVDHAGVRPAGTAEPDPAGPRPVPAPGGPGPAWPAAGLPAPAEGLPPAVRTLLAVCTSLGRPARSPGRPRPEPAVTRRLPRPAGRAGPAGRQQADGRPAGDGMAGGERVTTRTAPAPRRVAAEPGPRAGPGGGRPEPPPSAAPVATDERGWDPAFGTSVASTLYVVNLLGPGWLAIPRPGWATVELLARHVLGGQLDEVEDDPLWEMLAVLDDREPGAAAQSPPRFARVTRRTDALCAAHELGPATFGRAGRIALTRTHLDVLLSLDEVDLAARRCGIDQDPGWVPSLRRIVAFHFLGGTELLR